MPDEKDNNNPESQPPADLWELDKEARKRKKIADDLKEGRRKNSSQGEKNPSEEKPPKDENNK